MEGAVTALLCRTSDRIAATSDGARALAESLADRLGVPARLVGTPGEPADTRLDDDLRDARGCLLEAGIEQADAFVASTDGDNTNLVIAQIARRRFNVDRVVVRVLDPYRAKWYAEQGLQTICPTQTAIELLEAAVRGQIRFEGVSG